MPKRPSWDKPPPWEDEDAVCAFVADQAKTSVWHADRDVPWEAIWQAREDEVVLAAEGGYWKPIAEWVLELHRNNIAPSERVAQLVHARVMGEWKQLAGAPITGEYNELKNPLHWMHRDYKVFLEILKHAYPRRKLVEKRERARACAVMGSDYTTEQLKNFEPRKARRDRERKRTKRRSGP